MSVVDTIGAMFLMLLFFGSLWLLMVLDYFAEKNGFYEKRFERYKARKDYKLKRKASALLLKNFNSDSALDFNEFRVSDDKNTEKED